MKTTFITLASVAALAGAVNAQTTWKVIDNLTADVPAGTFAGDIGGFAYTGSVNFTSWTGSPFLGIYSRNVEADLHANHQAGSNLNGGAYAITTAANLPFDVTFNFASAPNLTDLTLVAFHINDDNPTSINFGGSPLSSYVSQSPASTTSTHSARYANGTQTFTFSGVTGPASDDVFFTLVGRTVPEPSSAMLLGLGALGLIGRRKRA